MRSTPFPSLYKKSPICEIKIFGIKPKTNVVNTNTLGRSGRVPNFGNDVKSCGWVYCNILYILRPNTLGRPDASPIPVMM